MKQLEILVFISVVWAQDVSCSTEIEYYQNDNIEFCTLSREDTLSGQPFPSGTGFILLRRVYLIGVFSNRIQKSKDIYVEVVVIAS